jgi:hypothetical protein
MYRKLFCILCLVLLPAVAAMAREEAVPQTDAAAKKDASPRKKAPPPGPKELSGMSIVGNDEAPKSLYIVPWKSSELGTEASLGMMMNDGARPVDREVFKRQLEYYEVCTATE